MTNKHFSFFNFMLFLALLPISQLSFAQNIQWQKCFGGTNYDEDYSMKATPDGGYIFTASTESNDGDVSGNHGMYDAWVVKMAADGSTQWQKCFGGVDDESLISIATTTDGGYVLAGAKGNFGGSLEAWVIKITTTGTLQWEKTLGGTGDDLIYDVKVSPNGGYILTGLTTSNDGDVSGNHGVTDAWVVKMAADGSIQWQKTYGGTSDEGFFSMAITIDGGYVLAGTTGSNDGDVSGNHGNNDAWVVKITATGILQWQKTFGGTVDEQVWAIKTTTDGYILAGMTTSNDGDVSGYHGSEDGWLIKTNLNGVLQWQKILGGTLGEEIRAVEMTADGGYILAGYSESNDGDVSGNHGGYDAWIVKISSNGSLQWQKTYGGTISESAHSIQLASNGGYLLVGTTNSDDGDVSGNHGIEDVWVVKLDNSWVGVDDVISLTNLIASPNPVSGNKLTLNYHLSKTTSLEINIADILGNSVLNEKVTVEAAGEHQKEIKLDAIPSGIYFLQVTTEYGSYTTKIIKN